MPPRNQTQRFRQLLADCWNAYDRRLANSIVVRPAIPILFFGDSNRYFASPLKIVTVGLNPSKAEFPLDDSFKRFPAARGCAAGVDDSTHLDALNNYFRTVPYRRWFASFEPILAGLDCSYYDGQINTALHTDLCSPIATDPTWSKLGRGERRDLLPEGVKIWHSLVEILSPDVILVSIAEKHLTRIEFRGVDQWKVIWNLERKQPYQVRGRFLAIGVPRPSLLAFGRAANTPFGLVSNVDKLRLGCSIKGYYNEFGK